MIMIKGLGVFMMQTNIETNKNENQNDGLIFVSGGVERLDGTKSTGSENYIMIKMSDLESLGINYQSQFNIFKQTEKDGKFVVDSGFCPLTKKYKKAKPNELMDHQINLFVLFEFFAERGKIEYKNCFETMCSSGENIYGLRFCFTKGNTEKKLNQNVSLDDHDLVWLELVCNKDGDKFLNKYNWQNKTWEPTDISFGLRDIFGGNDFNASGKNTVLEMYPKKIKFLTHFISHDSISIKEDDLLFITNTIKADTGLKIDNVNVCACMQFKPNGPFYVDWNEKAAMGLVSCKLSTLNDHKNRMQDVLALRFYFTDQELNVKCGDLFDNQSIKNAKKSVFEIRRDKNGNIILWHYDLKKKIWLPVNATVGWETAEKKNMSEFEDQNAIVHSYKDVHQYKCNVIKNADELYSYTVSHLCILDCHKPIFAEHFDSKETRNGYVKKLKDTQNITGDDSEFYQTQAVNVHTTENHKSYLCDKIPKQTFSSEVKYESIEVDMTKQVDLFGEKENSNLITDIKNIENKDGELVGPETPIKDNVISIDKNLNSRQKKTILYAFGCFIKKHKSKMSFSVIVGVVIAFLFSWFSVVNSVILVALFGFFSLIVLFLLLLALDKFIECPSVEDWFRCCDPSCKSKEQLNKDNSRDSLLMPKISNNIPGINKQ